MTETGLWIVMEGADGTGKTTLVAHLAKLLERLGRAAGIEVIATRHPGSTPLGAHIRKLVKTPHEIDPAITIDPISEQTLLAIDHINFKNTILLPALERGAIVLSDRCNLISSIVYGHTTGISYQDIQKIYQLAMKPLIRKLYILRCSDDMRRKRLLDSRGGLDKFEKLVGIADVYDKLITGPLERTMLVTRAVALDDIIVLDSTHDTPEKLANQVASDIWHALPLLPGFI